MIKIEKIANIDREILHNFLMIWGISMKFSVKMCLLIISKVTKNQGFTLYLEDTFFEKPHGGEGGDQIDSPAVLGLRKVNVTPYGFDKMCMNKELIKDKIYQ